MGNEALQISLPLVLLTILTFSAPSATASASDRRYNVGDHVPLFVNKVGPLNNPSETYQYYDLPFCYPDPVIQKKESIGEVLNGDRLANTLYQLNFRQDKNGERLCQKKLKVAEVAKFRDAIVNDFYFQMYYDDLPVWGFVGKVEDESWTISDKGTKCSNDEEEDKEVGWKYIHGDVFRYPSNMPLFCAVLGVGTQLLIMVCILFFLAIFGVLYPYNRGALFTSLVFICTLTSIVAGYTAAAFHTQFSVIGWERSVLLTAILYLGPLFVISSILNTVAISYGATAAIPFGTLLAILLIYAFLAIPLHALGGVIGYCLRSEFQAPCATKQFPREIQRLAWYRRTHCQMFIGGLLPFSAIALQLHHLYASMWGYKIYTLPGILFLTFIILIIMTSILTVGLTYIQLSVEDHEWWWRSVLSGGSTAIFMFAYSIYFYARSNMTGFMQLSFFIGYNACICYAFFLMLGAISFRVSLIFVRHIYGAVKSE
ncbi:transmembrane 9 superfamily member 5 isoform X3 [Prunus yedoensis var. nudiflora]|uniref:Transmembrane 9 superfamily member n=1 Tax=Prunus yedoensis var. nudiflora TaxID=2094558 RepID=A0A314YXR1_PRUYE|nr:transmembrane 9 superfamily member 5 isoform X3 [Prunus yedoensis var. nudiflora]